MGYYYVHVVRCSLFYHHNGISSRVCNFWPTRHLVYVYCYWQNFISENTFDFIEHLSVVYNIV